MNYLTLRSINTSQYRQLAGNQVVRQKTKSLKASNAEYMQYQKKSNLISSNLWRRDNNYSPYANMTDSITKSEEKKPILALEPPPPRDSTSPIQLNVSTSEPVSLYNQLGPTIVASDGVSPKFL